MGVLEFFGTLIKHDVTASSIKSNFTKKSLVDHLFLDFNSIIHVSSQKIIVDVNVFLQLVLKNLYQRRPVTNIVFVEKFEKFGMKSVQKQISLDTDPNEVVRIFQEHFTEKLLDKMVITLVINTVLRIVRTYCENKQIKTLLLAIDGVPSKGKMIEQKQRRYMGALTEEYKKRILFEYRDYLLEEKDYIYLGIEQSIKWSRNKITPGTAFMHKLVSYLKSTKIQTKFKVNRPQLDVIVSDMYEIGEGEKKIVNYVNKNLANTTDIVMVYSPDADMILLCMLMPVQKTFMLRHNNQTAVYDLIDVNMLKSNISYYINHHPGLESTEQFDMNRINNDLVCISTLFGNDFVPKIETLNVKKGFQNLMDAYLKTLLQLKSHGYYLVKKQSRGSEPKSSINLVFLKTLMKYLLPEEDDFIKHNKLYGQYIKIGQIKNVFDYVEINAENLVPIYREFRQEYENLKNVIKNNGNYTYFATHDQFMNSLKKSVVMVMDGQCVTTNYLSNKEMIRLLQNYYRKYRDFPKLNINLDQWSRYINDPHYKKETADFNDYQKELFKFEHMLDKYYTKFNAQPLSLTRDKIDSYYETYFGITLLGPDKKLTADAEQIMHDYLEGLLWVFDYYFNDPSYINTWYYEHERAPLLRHFLMFLDSINIEYLTTVFEGLDKYHVKNLANYFNPIEQLIYVSPMTHEVLKLLPSNYRDYINSDDLDPFLKNYFVNIEEIVDRLWLEKISSDIDCRGIIFFNKCSIKSVGKPTAMDDKQFLKAIRKVKPTETSIRRSKIVEPEF